MHSSTVSSVSFRGDCDTGGDCDGSGSNSGGDVTDDDGNGCGGDTTSFSSNYVDAKLKKTGFIASQTKLGSMFLSYLFLSGSP